MDVSAAIVAKSDQLNAIDLVGRDVTVTIVDVKPGPADQPVHIITDAYGTGRPWKPSIGPWAHWNSHRTKGKSWTPFSRERR